MCGCLVKVAVLSSYTPVPSAHPYLIIEVKPDTRKNDSKPPTPINEELSDLLAELEGVTDPFLLFLCAFLPSLIQFRTLD